MHQEAVTLMQGSIELPGVLTEFGMSLHGLAAATQDPEVASQARGVLRDAVEAGLEIAPAQALDGALAWRRLALDGPEPWHDMATASDAALTALRKLLRSQLFRADKEAWLRTTLDVSASAAVAHASTGALRHAMVTLESGRGLILVEALPPVGLERSQPQLFARFKAATTSVTTLEQPIAAAGRAVPAARTSAIRWAWMGVSGDDLVACPGQCRMQADHELVLPTASQPAHSGFAGLQSLVE